MAIYKQKTYAKEDREVVKLIEVDKDEQEKNDKRRRYQELRNHAQKYLNSAINARKRYDWEWLTRDLFRRGYQFSRYNPSNRTVIISGRQMAKIPVNLVQAQMRIVKNQVTGFKPKWEAMPTSKTEEALNNARYSQKLLDYYHERLRLRKMIKETVMQGLMYSVGGPWQIGFDPEADNGRGEVYVWLIDTYDFYVDPMATSLESAEYCVKSVRKPIDEIKNNPAYKFYTELEQGDSREARSEYKQFLLQALKYNVSYEQKAEGVLLNEFWQKIRINDKNVEEIRKELKENDQDTKDLRKGEVLMRVITYIDTLQDPLQVKLIRRSDFPFVMYQADINPVELYGEGWIKHIIPMNRVLNALESSIFQYNYMYAKGRIVIDKNSGVRMINNEHGSIIEKNPGATVTSLPLQPLPQSYDSQVVNMRRYIEDIGGAHEISLGRVPSGVKSGVGIAELKSSDATNSQDLVDNLEDFLCEVGKKLLKEIALNYDVPRVIKALGKGGKAENFAVIGEAGAKNRKNNKQIKIGTDVFDLSVIGTDNEIRVTIGSWLAYTKTAQQDKLKEYYQSGLIDQKTFLEHAEFSDVESIVENTRKEELLKKFRGQPASDTAPSDEEIAEQENVMMTKEGKMPEAMQEDQHEVHIIVHQEAMGINGNPIIEAHIAQHEDFIRKGLKSKSKVMAGGREQVEEQEEEPQEQPSPEQIAQMMAQTNQEQMPPQGISIQ